MISARVRFFKWVSLPAVTSLKPSGEASTSSHFCWHGAYPVFTPLLLWHQCGLEGVKETGLSPHSHCQRGGWERDGLVLKDGMCMRLVLFMREQGAL